MHVDLTKPQSFEREASLDWPDHRSLAMYVVVLRLVAGRWKLKKSHDPVFTTCNMKLTYMKDTVSASGLPELTPPM